MTARSAREEILGDIKRALRREGKHGESGKGVNADLIQLEHLVAEIRKDCELRRDKLNVQFEAEVNRIGGRFHRATNADSALRYIQSVVSTCEAKRIVAWDAQIMVDIGLREEFNQKGIELLTETTERELTRKAETADIGVSGVDYALADTGTLVLLAQKGQARSISLLPPVHIAIVRPQQILSGLSDLFPLLRSDAKAERRDLSSAITFITGPSRTADIELTLVVGVHGPQQLHVILLE